MSLLDRRRLLGPTDTVKLEAPTAQPPNETSRSRKPAELRKVFLRQSTVSNASGSSYIEIGDTQIQCTVNGPRPVRGVFTTEAELSVEFKFSPYIDSAGPATTASSSGSNGGSNLEACLASFVRSSVSSAILLEQYPKSSIGILISVLSASSNSKSVASAAVAAATVALANAGIAMRDIVTAGSVLLSRPGEEVYLDPENPAQDGQLEAVVSYMTGRNGDITSIWTEGGAIAPRELDLLLKHSKTAAVQLRSLIDYVLIEQFKNEENGI